MKNSIFARFARAFFIFDILKTFSFFLWDEMTCFAVVRTTWACDDKCKILYEYYVNCGHTNEMKMWSSQLKPRKHFSGLLCDCLNRNHNCDDHIFISYVVFLSLILWAGDCAGKYVAFFLWMSSLIMCTSDCGSGCFKVLWCILWLILGASD